MKKKFSAELAYVLGIVFVAIGVVLMEKADFGVSMVVAPAYLLYRALSPTWSFVTFGMAEYCLQAVLLLVTAFLWQRAIYYVVGMLFCSAGVSAMFHTYISPEVYELFVKEVSGHFRVDINKFKTGYDCVSSLIGVAMSFLVFGLWHFVGVSWGTILCALINGTIIGRFSAFYEKHWTFYRSERTGLFHSLPAFIEIGGLTITASGRPQG